MLAVATGEEGPARPSFRDWPTWARRTTYGVALVVLLVLALVVAVVVMIRRPLPDLDGARVLSGLDGPVEILRDDHGIPQIYADTSADLFFAQGYVHAQDRFYEMDFRRHVTAGRISELVGESGLEADMLIRTMGWRRVAAQEYRLLAPETRAYLRAYSAGVNAYITGKSATHLSLEYTVLALGGLNYRPERWTPVDSLAWLKAMAWDLGGNMDEEIARARLSVNHTSAEIGQLYPSYDYDRTPIVPGASKQAARPRARPAYGDGEMRVLDRVERVARTIPRLLGTGNGLGSNSWVVSGEHTATGKPLLANDPHLGVSMPGIWYQMGLHCRQVDADCPFDVTGFTFSGFPGVVIGHNRDIAWGFTNLGPDVMDLYLEEIRGKRYLYDGKLRPLTERDEVIRVAGGSSKLISVRSTPHGPLVSDVSSELSSVGANAAVPSGAPPRENGYAVALSWTALTPRPTADAVFMIDRAAGWGDFREAARRFAVPSQNLVYADTAGHIGYQAPGAIPIRKGGRLGDYPVAGWLPRNDWTGKDIPFDELPSVLDPPEGFIVTANQAVTGPTYPYYLTNSPDQGYRSQRIRTVLREMLDHGGKVDVTDMTELQLDDHNPIAPVLVPYLMRQLMTSEYDADGQRLLSEWDYSQSADSAAAAYFNAVWSNLLHLTFADDLPESLWPDGGDRWIAVVTRLLDQPQSSWWDNQDTEGVVENRDMILTQALRDARSELTVRTGVSPGTWRWGRLHGLELENQSVGQSDTGLVRALFNRGPFAVGGGDSAVDATSWDATEGYQVTSAPSMRMVVDLADLDRSRWISLTGVSGHPASSHYTDQTELWVAGRTLPWLFSAAPLRRSAEHTLTLRPRRGG